MHVKHTNPKRVGPTVHFAAAKNHPVHGGKGSVGDLILKTGPYFQG